MIEFQCSWFYTHFSLQISVESGRSSRRMQGVSTPFLWGARPAPLLFKACKIWWFFFNIVSLDKSKQKFPLIVDKWSEATLISNFKSIYISKTSDRMCTHRDGSKDFEKKTIILFIMVPNLHEIKYLATREGDWMQPLPDPPLCDLPLKRILALGLSILNLNLFAKI